MASPEAIGAILGQSEFKLTQPPEKPRPWRTNFYGTRRRRRTAIRLHLVPRRHRTLQEKAIKAEYQAACPPDRIITALVKRLLTVPELGPFDGDGFAKEVVASHRSVQRHISNLESRHLVRRVHQRGGRGHLLVLRINTVALQAFARRLGIPFRWAEILAERVPDQKGDNSLIPSKQRSLNPDLFPNPDPDQEKEKDLDLTFARAHPSARVEHDPCQKNASGFAGGPNGQERLRRQEAGISKPKWPTSKPKLLAELVHGDNIQDTSARWRYRMGTMRRAAGLAGLPLRLSHVVVAAFLEATAAIGKAAKRDDLAKAVILRLVYEGLRSAREIDGELQMDAIGSWTELLSWIHSCERWLALRRLERAVKRSGGEAQTGPTEPPGRVFDRGLVAQYPKSPVRSDFSPTAPRSSPRDKLDFERTPSGERIISPTLSINGAQEAPPLPLWAHKKGGKQPAPYWLIERLNGKAST